MKNLLITGFDPFGGEDINPAWEAVRRLPATIGDYALEKLEIPTVYGQAAETAIREAVRCKPDVVLCIGQAGGRDALTPEFAAINHRNASIPDNAGTLIRISPILSDAPDAYFATVPVYDMADAAKAAGISAHVSYSTGTFVCNDTLFLLLHHFHGSETRVGFVHVPFLPEQTHSKAGQIPSMPLETIIAGLTAMIQAL